MAARQTSSKSSGSSGKGAGAPRGKKSSSRSSPGKKTPDRSRQRLGGVSPVAVGILLLALGTLTLLSLLPLEGFVLRWCFVGFAALLGPGVYALPPALLAAGVLVLLRHRDKYLLRTISLLVLPLLVAAIVHRYRPAANALAFSWALPGQLLTSGQALTSGGLLGGLLAMALSAAISPVGCMLVLAVLLLVFLCIALALTPAKLYGAIRDVRQAHEEDEELPAPAPRKKQRRGAIDIPLDDEPQKKPPQNPADFLALLQKEEEAERRRLREQADLATQDLMDPLQDMTTMVQQPPIPTPPEPEEDADPTPPWEPEPAQPVALKDKPALTPEEQAKLNADLDEKLKSPPPYVYPPLSLLAAGRSTAADASGELRDASARLMDTLHSFHIEAQIVGIIRGPSVTRFEMQLPRGVKFSKLTALADDIALALGALSVRIAPIPDKVAVGIEVPNKTVQMVYLREVIGSPNFQKADSRLSFALGKDITGTAMVGDIARMPHMLIAGTTGSGKSVCINSLLISLLYKSTPEEVRLIMIDPKMIELGGYNGIPHLLIPVVTDPKKASGALNWAVGEMMKRYQLFASRGVRDLAGYNKAVKAAQAVDETVTETVLPQIVIVIDELADLMMVAAREVEDSICRIAQLARAAGMHLVIATQRPSTDVITGIMKANIPSRIAFSVASQIESRIILDQTGAEKLIGKGDMLYHPIGAGKPVRIQGCFLSTEEVERVVEHIKKHAGQPDYSQEVLDHIERQSAEETGGEDGAGGEEDPMLMEAVDIIVQNGQASVSLLQRRLKLGYARAARLVDQMEERGIVGPFEGSKPRTVLITKDDWQEMKMRRLDC